MSRILVLDGAMATLQMQTGMEAAAIHRAYLAAGADMVRSDSFSAGNDDEARRAADAARLAADEYSRLTPHQPRLVVGVINHTLAGLDGLVAAGVDLLLAETLASVHQIEAAIAAVTRRRTAPPLMLSFAVTPAGRLPSGEALDDGLRAADGVPLYSLGLNCGSGVEGLRAALETVAARATCRVSCHPSAGLPNAFGWFDEPPATTVAFLEDAARAGLIDIAGGCCGTTPAAIAAIARAAASLPASARRPGPDRPARMAGFRE